MSELHIWMPKPEFPNCPPGLEYLTQIDQLIFNQSAALLEAVVGIECQNKFKIRNSVGQQVYFAGEESGFCTRQCCGPQRGFVIHMVDNLQQEVLRYTREFKCCAGCCWFAYCDLCAYEVKVEAPVGHVIGYVRQTCSIIKPCYEIKNEEYETILKVEGPYCICRCPCFDDEFTIYTNDEVEVGKISRQWPGLVKSLFTEADNFGVTFPMDLDVNVKATVLGAVFLINMMFYEQNQQGSHSST